MADVSSKPAEGKVEANVKENVEAKPYVAKDRKTYSGKSFKDVEHFINKDDQYIFCKTWKPKGKPKALLLILHGFSEHLGWFAKVAETIVELDVLVFAHDFVGHGESEGYRCDVSSYEVYLRDIRQHINIIKNDYPDLPLFIFGHSMGGGLTTILAGENPDLCKGVILSAPLIVDPAMPTGAKLFFMKAASLVMPRVEAVPSDPSDLTRSAEGVEKFNNDSLNDHGRMRLRMAMQYWGVGERAQELLSEISLPVIALQGNKDVVCDIKGAKQLIQVAKSEDKTLKVYEGAYHELLYEIDDVPQTFLNDIKEWLQKRISE